MISDTERPEVLKTEREKGYQMKSSEPLISSPIEENKINDINQKAFGFHDGTVS